MDRVRLWTDIREKLLPNPQLKELLSTADITAMPNWWVAGEYDAALLTAVDKYGNCHVYILFFSLQMKQ